MICFDLATLDFAKDPRQSSLMKALVGITALPIDFLKLEQCDLCQRRSVYYTGFQCIKSVYQLLRYSFGQHKHQTTAQKKHV